MFKDPDILNFPRSAPSSAQLSEKVHSIRLTFVSNPSRRHNNRATRASRQGKYIFVLTLQSRRALRLLLTLCYSVELSWCKQSLNVFPGFSRN